MLDTDTVSFILRGAGKVPERIIAVPRSEVCVSAITAGELRRGAHMRRSRRINFFLDTFFSRVRVESFGEEQADAYGRLAAKLARDGIPIGDADTMIAAHALTLRATIVTHNRRHFDRVRGLKVDDWYE